MTRDMDQLSTEQEGYRSELLKVVTNYRKDSPERKSTAEYYKERLRRLGAAWELFEAVDSEIRTLPEPPLSHAYFTTNCYEKTRQVYDEYQVYFTKMIILRQKEEDTQQKKLEAEYSTKKTTRTREEPLYAEVNKSTHTSTEGDNSSAKQRTDESSEVTRVIRRQRAIIESLRRLITSLEGLDQAEYPRCFYELKIQSINQYWAQLEEHNLRMWELVDEPSQMGYDGNQYVEIEKKVQQCLILLSSKLDERPQARSDQGPISTMLKLPKITLPKFDGDYARWRQFHDLFSQMVHNQPMSNCQKMWYLKTNLLGEAEKLVRHYTLSDQNYMAAWKILQDRYENPRLLVASLVNKILTQPSHAGEGVSATAIKVMHDTIQECLLGLENLGVSTSNWDPLLLHILLKKIDKTTHTLYEQSLSNPKELQSVNGFLNFLEIRFQSLEALGSRRFHDDQNRRQGAVRSLASVLTSPSKCAKCKGQHRLFQCQEFIRLSPESRANFICKNGLCLNCLRPGHNAAKCTMRGCTKCSKKHNTLIHTETSSETSKPAQRSTTSEGPVHKSAVSSGPFNENAVERPLTLATTSKDGPRNYVLLSTARVKLISNNGREIECRAILDSGSQVNLITERVVKKLGLNPTYNPMSIHGVGNGRQKTTQRINVTMESRITKYATRLEAFVMTRIISPQPAQTINTSTWAIPCNIQLADPHFNEPSHIDLLLGAEFYHELLSIGQIKLEKDLPTLQNTVFGWVVAGRINQESSLSATCGICTDEGQLNKIIERFWKIEDSEEPDRNNFSLAEKRCETHFNQTVQRHTDGRFIVNLPFSDDPSILGHSKEIALRRFTSLERRLARQPDVRQQYADFMKEYLELGHMEEVDINSLPSPHYFLPHHCVVKPDSSTTKLRVVFDASAKTSSNVSLNEILHAGPTIQDDIFSILLRFRLPRFVFTADIQKMYRQIWVHERDQKYQLILWRDDPNQSVKCYKLRTVTYGTTPAPYLATKCLQKLALFKATEYPLGAKALQNDFYVDDVMTGANTIVTTHEIQIQLTKLLQEAGFKLRKWCANHPRLVQNIPPEDQEVQLDFSDSEESRVKTLGLTWLPKTDQFCIRTNWTQEQRVTKRTVASDIARLFDPLGIMAPVVVTAKIFLQHLWELKLDWDAALPMRLHTQWTTFRKGLHSLNNVQFPRHVFSHGIPKNVQLHAFADASERAYGAAIYVRSTSKEGRIIVRLLCAKSRVAPTKKVTLPRLELCAAKLAAELVRRAKQDLKMEDAVTYLWSDSEIVLAWINSVSSNFQTFVANRIAAIQNHSIPQQWRHVDSKQNPADVLSRGISPERLPSCNIWLYGPPYLHGQESIWPPAYQKGTQCTLEKRRSALPITTVHERIDAAKIIQHINHNNSFRKLQRVMGYVLRFINRRKRILREPITSKILSAQELDEALILIVKNMQADEFKGDISRLAKRQEVDKKSPLSSLAPFLDERGVLRVGGRLEASTLSRDSKHPILLPYAHNFTKLILMDLHRENYHVGPQGLLSITRQRFWPIKGKTIARSVVQHCVRCAKSKPRLFSQIMGNLPSDRVQPARPFVNAGVDFCGPIWIHYKTRGKKPQKAYVSVFCCFATRAVHLELVSDLTTDAFIGALKRFMARRGHCRKLYCDNATNFVGARNQLAELNQAIYSNKAQEKLTSTCSQKGIDFHFIPPRAPHFGGLWEAAVKSAKGLLQRSVISASLTYEELETVMVEIEAILNSRPITSMSSDPNDLTALTPGHFLVGEPLTATIDSTAEPVKASLLKRWRLVTHIKNEFWKRWSQEYLHELQHRFKWKERSQNVMPGTIVLIKDDKIPVMKWLLGRITDVFKGEDGFVRVADVRTATGILRRPIHKLAPLPCEDELMSVEQPTHILQSKPNYNEAESNHREEVQASTIEDTAPPNKKKRVTYGSSVMSLLLACLILPAIRGNPVEVIQFQPQLGIHFENHGIIRLITTDWNLVVFYDLQPYWLEFSALENGTEALRHLCNQLRQQSSCRQIITQFEHLRAELEKDNDLLLTANTSKRQKRGAINLVGNVANSLFGLLDSQYAETMSQTINDIQQNEDRLLELLKNQTSVVDSTINIIKRDQKAAEDKFRALDDHITQIITRLNQAGEEQERSRLQHYFISLAIQLTLISTNVQRIQSAIIDVIIDSSHGKINPTLLSPSQLKQEIKTIRNHLPPSLDLPTSQDNILGLYKLMTVEGRIVNNHVIFRLNLPLVNGDKYDLFKVWPIPMILNNSFVEVEPYAPFLAISPHRDQYYPITSLELFSCTLSERATHLCKQLHPVYHRGSGISTCEIEFLNNQPNPRRCKLIQLDTPTIWKQLLHTNQWVFSLRNQTSIHVVCENEIFPIELNGSGLLKIQPNCIIRDDIVTIQGHQIYSSNTKSSYTRIGLASDKMVLDQLPMIPAKEKQYHAQLEELGELRKQINNLNLSNLPRKLEGHSTHSFVISYLALSLTLVVLFWLGLNVARKLCKRRSSQPITTRPGSNNVIVDA